MIRKVALEGKHMYKKPFTNAVWSHEVFIKTICSHSIQEHFKSQRHNFCWAVADMAASCNSRIMGHLMCLDSARFTSQLQPDWIIFLGDFVPGGSFKGNHVWTLMVSEIYRHWIVQSTFTSWWYVKAKNLICCWFKNQHHTVKILVTKTKRQVCVRMRRELVGLKR